MYHNKLKKENASETNTEMVENVAESDGQLSHFCLIYIMN